MARDLTSERAWRERMRQFESIRPANDWAAGRINAVLSAGWALRVYFDRPYRLEGMLPWYDAEERWKEPVVRNHTHREVRRLGIQCPSAKSRSEQLARNYKSTSMAMPTIP